MSHLKNQPASNSHPFARLYSACLLSFISAFALISSSGCATVPIPSYRLEDCAAESCSTTPALLPPLPMPGWLAKWKAEKHLPKAPELPRFHPLPTRPMFQPRAVPEFSTATGEAVCFGGLPASTDWNNAGVVRTANVPTLAMPN